jgi:hypothetical protein
VRIPLDLRPSWNCSIVQRPAPTRCPGAASWLTPTCCGLSSQSDGRTRRQAHRHGRHPGDCPEGGKIAGATLLQALDGFATAGGPATTDRVTVITRYRPGLALNRAECMPTRTRAGRVGPSVACRSTTFVNVFHRAEGETIGPIPYTVH